MNTRPAAKADIKTIKTLWENTFETTPYTDWFFDNAFYSANTVICEEEGEALGCACTSVHTVMTDGAPFDAAYIQAVAAAPENRNDETLNNLCGGLLGFLSDKNISIAFTVPDSYKLFEKSGFSLCYTYKQYDIKPDDLPAYGINGKIVRPGISDPETAKILQGIYSRFVSDKNGYALRTPENWRLILDDFSKNFGGRCVVLKNRRGESIGYMLYIIRDGKMGVYELGYSCHEGLEGLIGFIRSHDTVSSVSMKMPSNDLLFLNFCDRRMAVTMCPFASARIIDVKTVLKHFADSAPENLRIQIVDRLMEQNNKTFTFTQGDVITIDTDPNVITDIGTFTQLVLGFLSPEEAFAANLIKGDVSLLGRLLKKRNTYINMLI